MLFQKIGKFPGKYVKWNPSLQWKFGFFFKIVIVYLEYLFIWTDVIMVEVSYRIKLLSNGFICSFQIQFTFLIAKSAGGVE